MLLKQNLIKKADASVKKQAVWRNIANAIRSDKAADSSVNAKIAKTKLKKID